MGSGLKISSNPGANAAVRSLRTSSTALYRAVDRLSSGLRVNSAADGSASMSASENMRAQEGGFRQALRNVNDGVAMVQTAEAAYQAISDTLVRMRVLAIEAASDSIADVERGFLDAEFAVLITEMDRVASVTEFNNTKLLDGSKASVTFQIGASNSTFNRVNVALETQGATASGVADDQIDTVTDAQVAIDAIDDALQSLNTDRAGLGSSISKMNLALNDIASSITTYGRAIGNIRDADIGVESGELARQQVLQASGAAMLLQANAATSVTLQLLR